MKFLNLDDEQAAMLIDAADLSVRFLLHRSARIDPDRILSKAAELQANKLENVRAQLAQPEIAGWADIQSTSQHAILKAADDLLRAKDAAALNIAWRQLLAAAVAARHKSPLQAASPDEKS